MGDEIEKQFDDDGNLSTEKVAVPTAEKIKDISGRVRQRVGAEQVKSAELPEGTEFYQSGDMLVAFSRNLNKVYISRGGGSFIEQVVTLLPFGGKIRVKDPNEDSGIFLTIGDGNIRTREEVFEHIETPSKIPSVISVPEKIQTEYNFKFSDETPFVVTSDANAGDFHASFMVSIGGDQLKTIKAERFRDGGSAIIETDQGTFRVNSNGESPTWNGEPLLKVN